MPETTFHTTFSTSHFLLSRAKNVSESGLRSAVSYRFGFNGKENDNEVKGTGNSVDFGARMYDSRLGRWMACDPKSVKYPGYSPYHFGYCNPIITIDPNGEENVIVVGAQYDNSSANKLMFVHQAIRQAAKYKTGEPKENLTVVLFTQNYTAAQMKKFEQLAAEKGVTLVKVSSDDELVAYLNSKTGNSVMGSTRAEDPISHLDFFAHGTVGQIRFGYHIPGNDESTSFGKDDVDNVNASSFASGAIVCSYSCRTGIGKEGEFFLGESFANLDESLAQYMANSWKVTVWAYTTRTDYSGTLGSKLDRAKWNYSPWGHP